MGDRIECPAPGVYRGVEMDTYHSWPAASNSQLTELMKSPAHLAAYRSRVWEPTPAQILGTAIHSAVLEPEDFKQRYMTSEQCSALTRGGKGPRCSKRGTWPLKGGSFICTTHLEDESPVDESATVLSRSDHETCLKVQEAVRKHATAGPLLEASTDFELSIVWDDPVTGVRCKARLDAYAPDFAGGTVPDLKSAQEGGLLDFERAVLKWGYHRKAWFYLRGAQEVGLPARHFPMIVVEKEEPFHVDTYRISDAVVKDMENQMTALLELYAECVAVDHWPSRPQEFREITIPVWGWRQIDEETEEVQRQLDHIRRRTQKRGAA